MNSIATAISSSSGTVERTPVGIGIDGGGSNCRAWVFNARGQVLGQGQSGPANPVSGLTESFDAITTAAEKAVQDGGFPPSILAQLPLAIGLAGLHLPQFYQQFQQWQHPFASLHLTTDLQIAAYGVHQHQDGALIIYMYKENTLAIIKKWKIYLRRVCQQVFNQNLEVEESKIRKEICFDSIHTHIGSGLKYRIKHIPVLLYFNPQDN